jgi:hypothetical protein
MKVRAARLVNHPEASPVASLVRVPDDPEKARAQAYQILVTQFGVPPEKARVLLGF